jgi:hypothetical protein
LNFSRNAMPLRIDHRHVAGDQPAVAVEALIELHVMALFWLCRKAS